MTTINSRKKKKLLAAGLLVLLIAVSAAIYILVGEPMTALVKDLNRFRAWVDRYGWRSRVIFMAMVCLQVLVAIIPGEPLELAAGYVFGALEGTLLCLGGILAGSVIVFALVRAFGRRLVEVFFPAEKIDSLKLMQNPKRLFIVMAILMILPGTPKDLLTYCAGLTKIPFGSWILLSSLGRIPSVVTSTLCAHALGQGNYLMAAAVFLVSSALCCTGLWVYARIRENRAEQ